jgi:hypothetical protein
VNTTYVPGTLRYGSQGFRDAKWQMRQNHLTTDNNRGLMTDHQQTKRDKGTHEPIGFVANFSMCSIQNIDHLHNDIATG